MALYLLCGFLDAMQSPEDVSLNYVIELTPVPQAKRIALGVIKSISIDPKAKRLAVKAQFVDATSTKLGITAGLVQPNGLRLWHGLDGSTRLGPFTAQLTYEEASEGVITRNWQVGYHLAPQLRLSYSSELSGTGPQVSYTNTQSGTSGWVRVVPGEDHKPTGVLLWLEQRFGAK